MNDKPKKLNALSIEKAKYHAPASGKLLPNKLTIGGGLYLCVLPSGAKSFRYDYRYLGKRRTLTIGSYPELSLKIAQDKHIDARRLVAEGKDPAAIKQQEKERRSDDNTFRAVAQEWYDAKLKAGRKNTGAPLSKAWKVNTTLWLGRANDRFGDKRLPDIGAADVLALIKKEEARGFAASAEYLRQTVSAVFEYGILQLHAPSGYNPARGIRGAVIVPAKKHHPKLERHEIGPLVRAIRDSNEDEAIKIGLELLLHCFTRRSELVCAPWAEVQGSTWVIAANRMKMGRAHTVPLSTQAMTLFSKLKELAGESPWVFPSPTDPQKCRERQALNKPLWRMGYRGRFTPHSVRSTAASILAELGFSQTIVDLQLAHAEQDGTRAAYFRSQHLEQRAAMMQQWSDMIDSLAKGGNVIPIGAAA